MMNKVNYKELNSRQKENYNFQKVSSLFADYGYWTFRLNDDWNGADFIAQKYDYSTFLKVQLKSRLTFSKKYLEKDISICFPYKDTWYLVNHDLFLLDFIKSIENSDSWNDKGLYSWKILSKDSLEKIKPYKL